MMICAYCGRVAHRCECARADSRLCQFLAQRSPPADYFPHFRQQPYKRGVPPQIKRAQRALLRRHAREWYAALVEQYGKQCANCGQVPPENPLVLDHIVPIARGGLSELANLQLLCATCNRIKGKLVIDCRANEGYAMQIVDLLNTHETWITQAASILNRAFPEHWNAWGTMEEALEEVHEMLADDRICRVCVLEHRVVGWIGGIPTYDGNVWELHPLAVDPDWQGKGIGRALVADFERIVADRGGLTVMLGTDDEDDMTSLAGVDIYDGLLERIANIQNHKRHPYEFYRKCGYSIIGVIPDANGYGKPDILMGKRVSKGAQA